MNRPQEKSRSELMIEASPSSFWRVPRLKSETPESRDLHKLESDSRNITDGMSLPSKSSIFSSMMVHRYCFDNRHHQFLSHGSRVEQPTGKTQYNQENSQGLAVAAHGSVGRLWLYRPRMSNFFRLVSVGHSGDWLYRLVVVGGVRFWGGSRGIRREGDESRDMVGKERDMDEDEVFVFLILILS